LGVSPPNAPSSCHDKQELDDPPLTGGVFFMTPYGGQSTRSQIEGFLSGYLL
jgi:hypothetical protein